MHGDRFIFSHFELWMEADDGGGRRREQRGMSETWLRSNGYKTVSTHNPIEKNVSYVGNAQTVGATPLS